MSIYFATIVIAAGARSPRICVETPKKRPMTMRSAPILTYRIELQSRIITSGVTFLGTALSPSSPLTVKKVTPDIVIRLLRALPPSLSRHISTHY